MKAEIKAPPAERGSVCAFRRNAGTLPLERAFDSRASPIEEGRDVLVNCAAFTLSKVAQSAFPGLGVVVLEVGDVSGARQNKAVNAWRFRYLTVFVSACAAEGPVGDIVELTAGVFVRPSLTDHQPFLIDVKVTFHQ